MPTLPSDLRSRLERVVIEARDVSEAGSRAALEALAVHHHEPFGHMSEAGRRLRNHLRAHARQLGDRQDKSGRLSIDHLVAECAYEHWHRMLFARFLAENDLLIEPKAGIAISLAEAEELAAEEGLDVWEFASRCAQDMLPQIFRPDAPVLQVTFAKEHRLKLERLLASLPVEVFKASDALGWVYQFWQSKRKDEINRSEVKIGADEIGAVTQLFTEPYMVDFLLHNTLGAWWAGKRLTAEDLATAESEKALRAKLALPGVSWEYLRFIRGQDGNGGPWRPAAGTFDGWPKSASEIRLLDPCCGSGHFLVAALQHLVPVRMAEEGLSAVVAVDVVLRDNIYGLDIDERCCQIAAFALALAAWTWPKAGGHRALSELQIACTGIGPQATEEKWVALAAPTSRPGTTVESERISNSLRGLHRLFSKGPLLGSLLDPASVSADLLAAGYEEVQPYLELILRSEAPSADVHELAIAAAGIARAAKMLAADYTLVITNVPYLEQRKQSSDLRHFSRRAHNDAKGDIASVFVSRSLLFLRSGGSAALVTPQNWMFLTTYREFRERVLQAQRWNAVAKLGSGAFETISGEVVQPVLLIVSNEAPPEACRPFFLNTSDLTPAKSKQIGLIKEEPQLDLQSALLANPDSRIVFGFQRAAQSLGDHALCLAGIMNGDSPKFLRVFWELPERGRLWAFQQTTVQSTRYFGGMTNLVYFDEDEGHLREDPAIRRNKLHNSDERGNQVWGRRGIAVSQMSNCPVAFYLGNKYDSNVAAVVPMQEDLIWPVWAFLCSSEFLDSLKRLEPKMNVTNATIAKLPFDLDRWKREAAAKYPSVLPEPESNDPTQWLFHGQPYAAEEGTELQVAAARLLGYRWPAELDKSMQLSQRARGLVETCDDSAKPVDNDGIVCIPAVRGEGPAAERLLRLLNACHLEPEVELDDWLRNVFFEEHCKLFQDRPFIWQIWDGRKRDGFHALVNYHKLAEGDGKGRRLLESLTYAYLGDWISRQKDGVKRGEGGAEDRLAAALELQKRLEAILAGEPPFDLFVRWKPLAEQAIGWEPDINDGVRLNIRPFLASDLPNGKKGAGVLRHRPNVKWTKDRGKEPSRPKEKYPWFWGWDEKTMDFAGGSKFDGNRWNDLHYTNRAKQAAREAAKSKGKKR